MVFMGTIFQKNGLSAVLGQLLVLVPMKTILLFTFFLVDPVYQHQQYHQRLLSWRHRNNSQGHINKVFTTSVRY